MRVRMPQGAFVWLRKNNPRNEFYGSITIPFVKEITEVAYVALIVIVKQLSTYKNIQNS